MSKVRIHKIAKELGITSKDLIYMAQNIGFPIKTHANTISKIDAEALKATLYGITTAGYNRQQVRKKHEEQAQNPEAAAATAPPKPKPKSKPKEKKINPHVPPTYENDQEALMLVNMGKHDVRVSEHFENGFYNMVKVIAGLLSDIKQTVRTEDETLTWGELYFLRSDRSTPFFGSIELEYGDEGHGWSQRQKGILGDLLWSANWLNEDWKRPFIKLAQVTGIIRDPEGDFRNQLESDLHALEARGRILGLEEWDISTGIPGRNIYLTPKEKYSKKPTKEE